MTRTALCLATCLAASPALATGDFSCAAPDGSASVDLGVGHVPVLAIISVRIEAEGQAWGTNPADGATTVIVGQGIRTATHMAVDFTDPNIEGVVAELRTWSVSEGDHWAETGWLRIPGAGAWPLVCGEPG